MTSNAEDHAQGYHLDNNHDPDDALRKIRTTGSLSISPELFEKIYLSPQNKVAGELRKTVGNPTPVALVGFLLSLTPLSCDLMGWRGAGTNGASSIGFYIGFGGILMSLGAIGEWILGNTFPTVVFGSFGGFWIAFAMTLIPSTGAIANDTELTGKQLVNASYVANAASGLANPEWNAGFAWIMVFMCVLVTVYTICALRTNLVLFLILILLIPAFACLAAVYFRISQGLFPNAKTVNILTAAGGLAFAVCLLGWYIFLAILLASVDFPFSLPVVDLSHIIKGASDKQKAKEGEA